MSVRGILILLLTLWPAWGHTQGFAGLGTGQEGFALPVEGTALQFPEDHGAHPAFRIEWWYLTANLTDASGRDLGVQWTLFRSAIAPETRPGWQDPQLWLAHAAVTTPDTHHVAERMGRGGVGQAGVRAAPFAAWIDDWEMRGAPGQGLQDLTLKATGEDFAYALRLKADAPLVLQGRDGYSQKSPEGQASYYYSQPHYTVTGTLTLPDGDVTVTGTAWLDREWSSQPLSADQAGWDWISLHLDDGAKLMGFQLRDTGGGAYTSGTWIGADGTVAPFGDGALRMTPLDRAQVAGRDMPVGWRVELPERDLDLTLRAVNENAWMDTLFPYWEGPVRIGGSHSGRGYLEMTGYE
ncbi:lipocalin-like domain-containing protein [Actibacterium ureilyticum]|uniref:lipocalin-like domain-containing protein n=1 Tax=Actibacterium ureilyticum TaxID=1590614 RepID=UPI000BAB01AB|nr:lipocalin-like domain-containing protein [Actibacterium ureilyticum]